MKRLFFFFAALLCCVSSFAQMNFVATLQHNDTITHYYGQEAFTLAYNSAADGDVITLSEGIFNCNRTSSSYPMMKSITIRGAGYANTIINNGMYIATRNASLTTRIEGVSIRDNTYIVNEDAKYNKGKVELIKCKLNSLSATYSGSTDVNSPQVYVYNCIVNAMSFGSYTYPKYSFVNSYILNPYSSNSSNYNATNSNISFDHCVIEYDSYSDVGYTYYLNFYNCIFAWNTTVYSSCYLSSLSTATNCLSINNSYLFSYVYSGKDNKYASTGIVGVFKTYGGGVNDGETFELTDAAKTQYLGNDSTQLGMHGGGVPYNTKLQYPVVTKLQTQPRTTKDGKLTIDVQVDGK